jgi:hypothetical protein
MSDQALVWKFAFGALVLVFSAVAYVDRKDAEPAVAALAATEPLRALPAPAFAPSPAPAPAPEQVPAPPPEPLAAARVPKPAPDLAPADLPDVQEAPVRIHIAGAAPTARESKRPMPATASGRVHRSVRQAPAPRLHLVHATHTHRYRVRHPSPYAIGRQHYPFDPRNRWRTREG